MLSQRASGILLHVISLPGKYGIGTLGKEAFEFVDFLVKAKQTYWQILPLGHTGYGHSPYQCYSSRAGDPMLIDLDFLVEDGLLNKNDFDTEIKFTDEKINYLKVIDFKLPLLKKAHSNFKNSSSETNLASYNSFLKMHETWIHEYAFFMALKRHFDNKPWYEWETDYKMAMPEALQPLYYSLQSEIDFYMFLQYLFFKQWLSVKQYANKNNINIIGDIPIYVSPDSVDAWASPELFLFDENKNPIVVGGVPPDYFSETGQHWGNPLFRWEVMMRDGFKWWIERIRSNFILYDVVRIDHFRGFAAYWAIPHGEETAIKGEWVNAPGKLLFEAIKQNLDNAEIIAEDLGVITQDVIDLRDAFNLPGMKILQFAFDTKETTNNFLPHTYLKNCVVYTGTHDNEPVKGWYKNADTDDKVYALNYCNAKAKTIHWDMIRTAWASVANTAIAPMQDILGLSSEARMNLPGSTENNWQWKIKSGDLQIALAAQIAELTDLYGRMITNDCNTSNL